MEWSLRHIRSDIDSKSIRTTAGRRRASGARSGSALRRRDGCRPCTVLRDVYQYTNSCENARTAANADAGQLVGRRRVGQHARRLPNLDDERALAVGRVPGRV